MQTLLLLYTGGSLLLIILALPLLARKVKPNPFYGFRIQQTLENPELWYKTNRYFAKRQLALGIIQFIASAGLYLIPDISIDAYALACLGVFVVLFVIALAQSFRYIRTFN